MLTILLTVALAQQPTGVAQQVLEVAGQVESIDRAGRMVTITSAGVVQSAIYAGPDLPIFDQLARGDVVTIRYYDAVVVEVTPGARMKPIEDSTAEALQKASRPDASVLQQTRLVVTIDAVDAAAQTVTYHGFDNRRVLRAVRHPQLLQGLKAGDVVTITFTRAQAVGISKGPSGH